MIYYNDSLATQLPITGGHTMSVPFEKTQEIITEIVNHLAQMLAPGEIPHASEALHTAFLGCKLRPGFLEALDQHVWLASMGSVNVRVLPAEDAPPPVKGPGVYLQLISADGNCRKKFSFGPYAMPIRFIED